MEPVAAVHEPVMVEEVVSALGCRSGGFWVDATLGAGGQQETVAFLSEIVLHSPEETATIDEQPIWGACLVSHTQRQTSSGVSPMMGETRERGATPRDTKTRVAPIDILSSTM